MPDSEESKAAEAWTEGERAEIDASVDQEIAEGYAGTPVFLGAATVSLHLEYEDATSPVDAVNQALTELALNGLRTYTFIVRDEVTNQLYAVRGGQMVSLDQEEPEPEPVEG